MSMDDEFVGSVLGICLSLLSAFLAAVYKISLISARYLESRLGKKIYSTLFFRLVC